MKKKENNELVKTILDDAEALALAIENLDALAKGFEQSRLKKKAILVLLANYTKLPQSTIDSVLDGLANIKKAYLK